MAETRTISQVPALAAVSPNARMLVSEPGGLEGTVDLKTLFGKYIATDTATATVADLEAQLGYADRSIGLVFADPELLKNGWYRKAGAKGSGQWVQFETLSKATRESMLTLSGDGPPADNLGLVGQFYRDLLGNAEYGPKTDQGWGQPRSLIGASGPANSTFTSRADLAQAPATNRSYLLAGSALGAGYFQDLRGNFAAQVSADPQAGLFIPVDGDPTGIRGVRARVFSGAVDVRWYGATGDGTTNDTAAIVAADKAARLFGKDVFLPAGTYMIDPLQGTTNWRGEAGTVLKNRGNQPAFVNLVTFSGIDNLSVGDFTIHGNCSPDPVAWSSSNYDAFTGSAGLSIESCKGATVTGIKTGHTRQHGIRLIFCEGATVTQCVTRRCRGQFGDGYLFLSCIGLRAYGNIADDYTRIGMVYDSLGSPALTGYRSAIYANICNKGRDGSIMYGGTEFNSGIWCEHAADLTVSSNMCTNNRHRGISVCSGIKNNGLTGTHAGISVTGNHCADNRDWGIYVYSLDDLPIVASVTFNHSKGSTRAIEVDANTGSDSFIVSGNYCEYNAGVSNGAGVALGVTKALSGRPTFTIRDNVFSRTGENLSMLNSTSADAATGDIATWFDTASAFTLIADNNRHDAGGPIYINYYGAFAHRITIGNCDFHMRRGGTSGGEIRIVGASIIRSLVTEMLGSSALVRIVGQSVRGQIQSTSDRHVFRSNDVKFSDASTVWLLSNKTSGFVAVNISGNDFEKNVDAHGSFLRLGFGNVSFQALIDGNTFRNVGPPAAAKPVLEYASGLARRWRGNWLDDTITNVTMLDSGGGAETAVAGVDKIGMH